MKKYYRKSTSFFSIHPLTFHKTAWVTITEKRQKMITMVIKNLKIVLECTKAIYTWDVHCWERSDRGRYDDIRMPTI